jgi:hypothetical protein
MVNRKALAVTFGLVRMSSVDAFDAFRLSCDVISMPFYWWVSPSGSVRVAPIPFDLRLPIRLIVKVTGAALLLLKPGETAVMASVGASFSASAKRERSLDVSHVRLFSVTSRN